MTFNNQAEMASVEPLKDPIYTYNTEHKICRIAKKTTSTLWAFQKDILNRCLKNR